MEDFLNKKFFGIVEDNVDPERENRCKIRVINVFDGLEIEDLPWAIPYKDHNGLACSLPDVGKVVSIEFDNGDIYTPVYRYAEHYNVNLKDKLESLSEDDYLSMKSLLFDHKTQLYVNESEGLKFDHKFNLINIKSDSININLKDNFGSVNIGTEDASQQAILGNNFLDWFDVFVDNLLGSQGGPYFGNLQVPVIPHPALITHLLKYKSLKDPKFLSHNVNFNDNGYIDKLDRVNIDQSGDDWTSTKEENNLTQRNDNASPYAPMDGTKDTVPEGMLTTSEDLGGGSIAAEDIELPTDPDVSEDVLVLIQLLKNKGYILYDEPFKMNIIGIRYQYPGEKYSNRFKDKLYVFYKDDNGSWQINNFNISTLPGTKIKISESKWKKFKEKVSRDIIGKRISLKKYAKYLGRTGLGILQTAQYVNGFKLGYFPSSGKYKSKALLSISEQYVYRDNNWDSDDITFSFEEKGRFGIHIHRGFPGGELVNNWSEACQVLNKQSSLDKFISLMEKHLETHSNVFTYTLATSNDYDDARLTVENLSDDDKDNLATM
jgi:hypothetical protein